MNIITNETAKDTQLHPLIRTHRESGKLGLYGCAGYIVGLQGLADNAAQALLLELYSWQTQEQFQYRHQWQEGTLVMWDNRSVLHAATGGYDGQARLLHRTTIADTL